MADWNDFNKQIIAEFRANNGVVGGQFAGAPMVILTSTGAKSGEPREAPLVYDTDGDSYILIASKGGAPSNPDWYYNLKANPEAQLEIGADTFRAIASEATGAERDRLFAQVVSKMPGFGDYQKNTERIIPIIVLKRIA